MEGVPRLPMLRLALKISPERSDFIRKIKWQIREHFHEDPHSYAAEMKELETLRASACHPTQDFNGCAAAKKYYCQLHYLLNRFNFDDPSVGNREEIYFIWNDVYTGMAYSTNDIKHEMACVLYNIGALHLNLGAMDNRQTSDGMKMSCSHFQCAAWAFQQLNDKYPQSRETDLCPEIIRFMATISLAEAQECILDKSIVDGRKPGIVAKVAAQIVDYYKSAKKVLDQADAHADGNAIIEVAGTKVYKSWRKYAEFKSTFYQSVSLLYMGIHSEEMQKMGERLAYYQAGMDKLTEATKMAKKLDGYGESISDAVSFTHDVVGGKLKAAEKENEFVYHEKVPERSALPEIKGASLVKGTPFDLQDPEVAGQDIFHRLVPMEAHEASSLYSEEKAKLLRRIGGDIEEKDEELAVFLASLQLDQLRVHLEPNSLPQELVDRCAAFSVESNAAQSLVESMGQLSSIFTDVESSLAEVQELLSEEQESEKLFNQGHPGSKRPPSMILKELSLEAGRFSDAHAKAADSNMLLHKAINSHLGNLRTLSLPLSEIQGQLPSLQESAKDQASVKELQRLLDKVEEMRKQRRMLYAQLREAIQADDITKLATHQTDLEALFTQELAKHQRLTSLIEQNLSAQEKILVALTEANARYADTRRSTTDVQQRRAAIVSSLLASADAYPDLLSKCQKGIEFYRKMEANVTKLLQRLRSVVRVQQEERDQQVEATTRARSAPSAAPSTGSTDSDGPKLKDFLQAMKMKDGGSTMAALRDLGTPPMPDTSTSYNYPYHRPAPLGAEQTDQTAQQPHQGPAMDGNAHYYGYGYNSYSQAGSLPAYSAVSSTAQLGPSVAPFQMPGTSNTAPSHSSSTASVPGYGYTGPQYSQAQQQPQAPPDVTNAPSYSSYSSPVHNGTASTQPAYPTGSLPYATPNPYATNPAAGIHPFSSAASYPSSTLSYSSAPATISYSNPASGSPAHQPSYPPSSSFATSYTGSASTNGAQSLGGYVGGQQSAGYGQQVPSGYYPSHPQGYADPAVASTYGYPAAGSTGQPAYGYGTSNGTTDSGEGYRHGITGTTNTAPLDHQAASSYQAGYPPVTPSGSGQYLQYPYYADPAQSAGSAQQAPYYYGNSYPAAAGQAPIAAPTLAPTPAQPAQPAQPVAQVSSNLELLSLLDLSVPMCPTSGGLLEPQPQRGDSSTGVVLGSVSGTTQTATNAKSLMEPQPLSSTSSSQTATISSSVESLNFKAIPAAASSEVPVRPPSVPAKDPLADAESAAKLASDVEKLDKLVDGLTRKSLNGPTPLDAKWKEVQELQERESARRSISVARCYPMKNRLSDVLPYDHNRIELPTTKDDYINASLITSLSPSGNSSTPSFIATQAPLSCSLQDFWTMIWQQGVELVVCLLSDAEMAPKNNGGLIYWPTEKGKDVSSGPWSVSLQSSNARPYCNERILSLSKQGESKQRVVIHLQFTAWPGNSFPASPAQFLQFTSEVLHFWQQQRSQSHPIVVHCLAGAGRTGLFCLLCTALADLAAGHGLVDVVRVAANLCQQRRNTFRDREHLLFAFQALLYHAQDLLLKRGILSGTGSLQGSPIKKSHPSQDFIHSKTPTPPPSVPSGGPPIPQEVGAVAAVKEVKAEPPPPRVESPTAPAEAGDATPAQQQDPKKGSGTLAILDPANFSMDGATPKKNRVTKESFVNKTSTQLGSAKDPADPLSQLDPLWSLTK